MPWIVPAARRRPEGLGLADGRLAACPDKPNCVGSQSDDPAHGVAPLAYAGDRAEARERLRALLADDPRAAVVTATDDYLHAEFRAFVFVDDVEFYLPADEPVVHVRSASRVGHSDLGANRRRVEALREAFAARRPR